MRLFANTIVFLLFLFISCTKKPTMDSASSENLFSRFPSLTSTEIAFDKVFRLESSIQLSTAPGHFLGTYPKLFVSSKDDYVLVDHMTTRSVYLFAKDGEFTRLIGGKGSGPGEYRSPIHAGFDARDNIYVYDGSQLTILMYDSKGEFIRSSPIQKFVDKFVVDRDENLFFYTSKTSDRERSTRNSIFKFDRSGRLLGTFCPQPKAFDGASQVSGGGIVADSDNVLFQVSAYEYVLRAFDSSGDQLACSEEAPSHYRVVRPATDNMKVNGRIPMAWYRSFTSIDDMYLYKQSLIIIRTSDISGEKPIRRLDILDEAGHLLKEGIVMPDEFCPFMWANENGLYFLRQGEADNKGNVLNQKILKYQLR